MEEIFIKKKIVKAVIAATIIVGFIMSAQKIFARDFDCDMEACPREITIADNGKIFSYAVDRKFNVILDRFIYTPNSLNCVGDQVLERTKSLRDLYPNQMERFLVVSGGTCILQTGDFSVTIIVTDTKN